MRGFESWRFIALAGRRRVGRRDRAGDPGVTPDDDFDAQLDLGERAFGVYSPQRKAEWLERARMRAGQGLFLGAFLGGTPTGAAIIQDMRQYWLGNPVKMAGISAVKVAPEHRGRASASGS